MLRVQGPPPSTETAPGLNPTDRGGAPLAWGAFWAGPARESFFASFGGQTRLGRDARCDVVLAGEDVSRWHAVVRRDGPLFLLENEGSRNGTFVNGAPVERAPLRPGDVVRIGGWVGVVTATNERAEIERLPGGLIVGPAWRQALVPAFAAAAHDLPLILEGETGTGKEVSARWVHERSGRTGPFVAVNCAAIPEALAEAELFGFRKGAFTGAEQARSGHFREADGGTLFLDEVIDLPLPLQSKLLRVLEQREVVPLGESRPVKIDVRIIVAAQEPLARAVSEKRFRADLYARLNGLTATLPPLRQRREEIPVLFQAFLASAAPGTPPAVSPRLLERLCLHDWPFNVREVALLARRLRALAGAGTLSSAHLPPAYTREAGTGPSGVNATSPKVLGDEPSVSAAAFAEALRSCQGNVSSAAVRLGISRGKAYRLMKGGNVDPIEARRAPR
jgi:sigma-54 dependent transcriptional regulator, acetoin dehydrogenase operon transcriptional activator AcoR